LHCLPEVDRGELNDFDSQLRSGGSSCSTDSTTWNYEAGESLGADVEPKSSSITCSNDNTTVSSASGTEQANEAANSKQSIANARLHCLNQ